MSAVRSLRKEVAAAHGLIAHIREIGEGDDDILITDTIQGETKLHEAIELVMGDIDECELRIIGLEAKEAAYAARRASLEKRKELLKAAVERAMVEAETFNVTLPTATLFLAKRQPSVVIETEADVPAEFWKQPKTPDPKIDKTALKEALKAGAVVPGARLDNGSVSLTIRR